MRAVDLDGSNRSWVLLFFLSVAVGVAWIAAGMIVVAPCVVW